MRDMLRSASSFVAVLFVFTVIFAPHAAAGGVAPGSKAPEIGLKDQGGELIKLDKLAGKVVLVDFWASWCVPCREELPVLDKLYKQYAKHGLVIIGVSIDEKAEALGPFLRRTPVSFPIVHDPGKTLVAKYAPPKMPSSYLIDRKGIVRYRHEGFKRSDEGKLSHEIEALLGR